MSSKGMSQIFNILFQTEDTDISVLCGVFFSRFNYSTVQLKSSFPDEQNISGKIWDNFRREAIKL